MSIKKAVLRISCVLAVAAAVGLTGCDWEGNPWGGNYNNDPVKIGDLWWTKNINIDTPNSMCYQNKRANCAEYGRLYTWEDAMSACVSMGGGWRLPTNEDWNNLVNYVGGANIAGKMLKSKSGWNRNGNGTDSYKFSALPGGHYYAPGNYFNFAGFEGTWWSATEDGGSAYIRFMSHNIDYVGELDNSKEDGYSVRCVSNG